MNSGVVLSEPAQRDIEAAKAWYAERAEELDLRFQRELKEVLVRIEERPQVFPVEHRDIRKATLRRFPYSVYFHRRDFGWLVLAVVHQAQHPWRWMRRR